MKIIFLGPQGSGKSTQAKLLADNLSLPYLEMGQILRDKAHEDSDTGRQIKQALDAGNLVPDEVAIKMLKEKLSSRSESGFLLDGYPRNSAQMAGLGETIDKVFYIKVSDEEAIKRLTLRGRHDDTTEALKRRLQIYHEKTEPLLDEYKKKGVLIEVDGERSIEEIEKNIRELVKKND